MCPRHPRRGWRQCSTVRRHKCLTSRTRVHVSMQILLDGRIVTSHRIITLTLNYAHARWRNKNPTAGRARWVDKYASTHPTVTSPNAEQFSEIFNHRTHQKIYCVTEHGTGCRQRWSCCGRDHYFSSSTENISVPVRLRTRRNGLWLFCDAPSVSQWWPQDKIITSATVSVHCYETVFEDSTVPLTCRCTFRLGPDVGQKL